MPTSASADCSSIDTAFGSPPARCLFSIEPKGSCIAECFGWCCRAWFVRRGWMPCRDCHTVSGSLAPPAWHRIRRACGAACGPRSLDKLDMSCCHGSGTEGAHAIGDDLHAPASRSGHDRVMPKPRQVPLDIKLAGRALPVRRASSSSAPLPSSRRLMLLDYKTWLVVTAGATVTAADAKPVAST